MTDAAADTRPTCFIARPLSITAEIASRYGGDMQHWEHVQDYLFLPALEAAGYRHLPTPAQGAVSIHEHVIQRVDEADLVIADFSRLNANVLFEAGVRTSVNKPLVIVAEEGTVLPFDTNTINTYMYDASLAQWDAKGAIARLTDHINATEKTHNALWTKFGQRLRADTLVVDTGDPTLSLLEDLTAEVRQLARGQKALRSAVTEDRTALITGRVMPSSGRHESEYLSAGSQVPSSIPTPSAFADIILNQLSRAQDVSEDDFEQVRSALIRILDSATSPKERRMLRRHLSELLGEGLGRPNLVDDFFLTLDMHVPS